MKTCLKCGKEIPEDAVYCAECEESLQTQTELKPDAAVTESDVNAQAENLAGNTVVTAKKPFPTVPVVIAAAAVVVIAVICIILFSGRGWESAVRQSVDAYFKGDYKKLSTLMPDGYLKAKNFSREKIENLFYSEVSGNEDIYTSYKITKIKELRHSILSDSKIKEMKDQFGWSPTEIREVGVYFECTFKSGNTYEDYAEVGVVKDGNSWYLFTWDF